MIIYSVYTEERQHSCGDAEEVRYWLWRQGIDGHKASEWCATAQVGDEYDGDDAHVVVEEI